MSNYFEVRLALSFLVFPSRLCVTFDIQIDLKTFVTSEANSEAYQEPCQTSKMKVFAKIVNEFSSLTVFTKSSILYSLLDSELRKK